MPGPEVAVIERAPAQRATVGIGHVQVGQPWAGVEHGGPDVGFAGLHVVDVAVDVLHAGMRHGGDVGLGHAKVEGAFGVQELGPGGLEAGLGG